jgi:hypothetical protein
MSISIKSITVKGYRNILSTTIDLQDITCLLAPNNYGKSNILSAIGFGYNFMIAPSEKKTLMMQSIADISINKSIAGKPYVFILEGSLDANRDFQYGYQFNWFQNNLAGDHIIDGRIFGEFFKIRDNTKERPKFATIFQRNAADSAKYLPSITGRCDKSLVIGPHELVINKLSYFDDLFYHSDIEAVLEINIQGIDSLTNPEMHFAPRLKVHKSGTRISIGDWVPSYLFDLKKEDKGTYDYLFSAIQILLPNIESMKPIRISLRTQVDKDAPFTYPDSYDIMVKEVYNNQATRLQYLSTGSMKILFLLTCIIRARKEGTQLLFIEELENSIHPNLMQALLSVIAEMKGDTKLLFTSHSPNVAKNLTAKQLYVGLPSDKGVVDFRTIKPSKVKSVLSIAGAGDMALGEYLFDLMLDTETDPSLIELFFTPKDVE